MSKSIWLCATLGCFGFLYPALADEKILGLSDLKPDRGVSLRLKDNQVINDVQLIQIDEKTLTYKNLEMVVKIDRTKIFRAWQSGIFYSDLKMSAADHEKFGNYVAYMEARGDVIVDAEGTTYIGVIVSESEMVMSIQTRAATYDVDKAKIVAWRKNGKSYNDVESKMERSRASRDPNDRLHKMDIAVFLHGPWAILPQFGAGLGANANWPVFFGARATLGYIYCDLNSLGLLAQASAYLNFNLLSTENFKFFVGTSYLWRAGTLLEMTYRSTNSTSTQNYSSAEFTQNIYTLHLGGKWKSLLFEAGVEMPISYKESYTVPTGNYSLAELANRERARENLARGLRTFNDIARVHLMISVLF